MPRVARSRSADGATTAALLPPSSSRDWPSRAATRCPTARPIGTEPVALTSGTPGWSTSGPPTSASPSSTWPRPFGAPDLGGGPVQQRGAGQRRQRGELGRLPHHGVAADERDRGVPRPHGDGEVERGDDPDDAERVPGLHQPVPGPLGGHRAAVELAREPDREVADVDHLLDLAAGLGADLADLEAHQVGERLLVLAEQLTEPLDQRAAGRCGRQPPGGERLLRHLDGAVDVGRSGPGHRQPGRRR